MSEYVIITDVHDRHSNDLWQPWERGSVSTYKESCGKKIALQIWEKRVALENALLGGEPEEEADEESSSAQNVGKIFHVMAEFYHRQDGRTPVFKLTGLTEDEAAATRLFNAYVKNMPASRMGSATFVEQMFPRTVEEKEFIHERLGVAPFKFIVDMLTYLTADDVQWLEKKYNCILSGPGWYVVDHKTSKGAKKEILFTASHQAIVYQYLVNELSAAGFIPEMQGEKCKGMIFNCIWDYADKSKKNPKGTGPRFEMFFARPPTPIQVKMVKYDFAKAKERIDNEETNGFACLNMWGHQCKYWKTNRCGRV